MSAEDILRQKTVDIPYFMKGNYQRPYQHIEIRKKAQRSSNTRRPSSNLIAIRNDFSKQRNERRKQQKSLEGLNSHSKNLIQAFSTISAQNKLILGGVLLAGVSILALVNFLKKDINTQVESYTEDNEYLGYNGRYDENDPKKGKENRVKNKIIAEAERQGVNPALALAVARNESGFRQSSKSDAGAIGIFQLMPATAAGLKVNPYDEDDNIKGGIKYLKAKLKQFNGDEKAALASYNAGPNAVLDFLNGTNKTGLNPNRIKTPHGIPPWTKPGHNVNAYVNNILASKKNYGNELSKLKANQLGSGGPIPANVQGQKVGQSVLKSGVTISEPMKKFIEESGLKGYITSSIRSDAAHKKESHWSGNKADIGLAGVSREEIIKISVTLMKHPAIVHIAYECFGPKGNSRASIEISKSIEAEIRSRYPDLAKRITNNADEAWKTNKFKVYHWGWQYGTGPHIDFLINPDKVGLKDETNNQKVKNKPASAPNSKPKNKVQNNKVTPTKKVDKKHVKKETKRKPQTKTPIKISYPHYDNKKTVNIGQVNGVKANKNQKKK